VRKLLTFSFVLALAAAIALPALADSPSTTTTPSTPKSHTHWFAGSVTNVSSSSLTVNVLWTGPHDGALNGQSVTVAVGSGTQVTSGPGRSPSSIGSVLNNDLVGVSASGLGKDLSSLTAVGIHINCDCHWVGGTITGLGSNSITVQVKRTGPYDGVLAGTSVTIGTGGSTVYIQGKDKTPIDFGALQEGDGVGIVFAANGFFRAPGFNPQTATFTASRVHQWGHRQVPPPSSDSLSAATTTA
jgi:hypothetical protein